MNLIKKMIADSDTRRPYWIDTAVYFSARIAKAKGGTLWAKKIEDLPELPNMKTLPTKWGFFRYVIECDNVPTETPTSWKAPRIAILDENGIPVQGSRAIRKPATVSRAVATPATVSDKRGQFVFQF